MVLTIEQMFKDMQSTWFGSDDKGYVGLCLAGEVGELCNNIKKELRSKEFREDKGKEIDSEIPDVQFYVDKMKEIRANELGMSVSDYNEMIWDRKMYHNTLKYKRRFERKFKYECSCSQCISRRIELRQNIKVEERRD